VSEVSIGVNARLTFEFPIWPSDPRIVHFACPGRNEFAEFAAESSPNEITEAWLEHWSALHVDEIRGTLPLCPEVRMDIPVANYLVPVIAPCWSWSASVGCHCAFDVSQSLELRTV